MSRVISANNTYKNINETVSGGYGEMYIHENVVPQTLTNQNTFYKVTDTWVNGNNSGFTADTNNSQLICNRAGKYQIDVQINYNGSNNDAYQFSIFVNGVEDTSLVSHTDARQAAQTISTPISGIISLSKNDTIDLRAKCTSSAGTAITMVHVNISLNYSLAS